MTTFHRDNLRKLATYLMEGRCCYEFDMRHIYEEKPCGTVACAIGHAPHAIGVAHPVDGLCKWWAFCDTNFGISWRGDRFLWCFASDWTSIDNTPQGAGQRILWLLRFGLPQDWHLQITGQAPLCYTDLRLDAPTPAVEPRRSERAPLTAGRPA